MRKASYLAISLLLTALSAQAADTTPDQYPSTPSGTINSRDVNADTTTTGSPR